jgi:hypothetical protein
MRCKTPPTGQIYFQEPGVRRTGFRGALNWYRNR